MIEIQKMMGKEEGKTEQTKKEKVACDGSSIEERVKEKYQGILLRLLTEKMSTKLLGFWDQY